MTFLGVGRRTTGLALGATALLLVSGGVLVGAVAGFDPRTHPRDTGPDGQATPVLAGSSGGVCKMGYDTQTGTLTPPDDSTSDNPPAGSIRLNKPCTGAVLGTLSSELSTPNSSDFVHLDMRATCVGTGGYTNPCTVGQTVFASPGHTFFRNGAASLAVHSMTMVWNGLRRGVWVFEALPGGNNSANLQFRTFTVEAFNGG